MGPVIGITLPYENERDRYFLPRAYAASIEAAGGMPILLTNLKEPEINNILTHLDGILLTGGSDVDPRYFGEEPLPQTGEITPDRDEFEIKLSKLVLKRNIPILAICRGIQVLNIAAGGTIYQDINTQCIKPIKHNQNAPRWYDSHEISIGKNTKLYDILGIDNLRVNSFHHQAIKNTAKNFIINAKSSDGIIEGIESVVHKFALGVQWHPECMWERNPKMLHLFKGFIDIAERK